MGGRDLRNDWKDGAEAYYGITVAGYPNLYQLVGPNSGLGHNSIIFMIEAQVHYIMECLKLLKQKKADYMTLKPDVQKQFNESLQKEFKGTVWSTGCSSWYQQEDGRNVAIWPNSTWKFWLRTQKVDTNAYTFARCKETAAKGSATNVAG